MVSTAAFVGNAQAQDAAGSAALVEKGRQLATAADCAACHTAPKGGTPFAGGYPILSPLGTIYASNITPSKSAGIGDYSLEDFTRALREGVRKDGAHLYPAMPYPSYTQLSDEDTAALYAYFMHGVPAVDKAAPQTDLPFPFNIRMSMAVWNALFLKDQRFTPDASKSAEWNRGAYLAGALAHCSTCHSPRNALMAEQNGSEFLSGGSLGTWYAPNITSDAKAGIGAWSEAELVQYLKTGGVHGKAQAAGPMAEAIENSLQHLPDADLKAIAVFLKQTPAVAGTEQQPRFAYGQPAVSELTLRGKSGDVDAGWRIFSGSCAHCHQAGGTGTDNGQYPSLFHNTATGADRPDNLVAAILYGVNRKVGEHDHFMPAFGDDASFTDRLSDSEIASVSNYVLTQYGNPAVKVTADDVKVLRAGGKPPFIAQMRPLILPAIVLVVLVVIALVALRGRRRRAAR
ncbi:c-type cytochrome [Xylophilus rhododendri]|uniref:C-type cytochrome n=1 Tax=Xylophilus rhododendri TaxID=2697032 RepID=A0A857J0J5_9BURK|nr:cytochrome c [Xylophilus rhododendri]QHI96709.1 c-type cytochrome [Xylophilus rhododendri]